MTSLLLTLSLATGCRAQAPVEFTFESDEDVARWTCTVAAELTRTQEPEHVKQGQGALQCAYTAQPGAPFGLTCQELELTGAKSLSLSFRASAQASLVLTLAEADGSQYHTFVTGLGGEWADVKMPLTDFQLQDGSTDENEGLDADQVASLTLQELANMPGDLGQMFGQKQGAQTFHLDAVRFGTEALPSRSQAGGGKVMVDGMDGSALHMLAVGGSQLSRAEGADGDAGSALRLDYTFAASGAQAWPGIVVPVGHVDLSNATAFRVRLKAVGPLGLHILLEELDGSRYECRGIVADGGEWQAKDFRLADLTPDPSRQDENNQLDLDQLRVVVLVGDVYNALLDENEGGQFTLDDILFLTR